MFTIKGKSRSEFILSKRSVYICTFLSFFSLARLEPCDEPLGMESGLIPDSKILAISPSISHKTSIRLNSNVACSNISSVLIDLGRLMKITGFAFSSDKVTTATIRYGVDSGDVDKLKRNVNGGSRDWIRVTSNSNLFSSQKRTIQINKGSAKIVIPDVFTLRYIKLMFSDTACMKLEIYGCPEICSSIIPKPNWNSLNLQYLSPVTVSGLVLQPQTTAQNLDVKCFMRNTQTHLINKQIPASSNNNIAVWFDKDYVCDRVQVTMSGLLPAKLSVVGCQSGCMEKLIKTATNEIVSASNSHRSYTPENSFLNNMESSWVSVRPLRSDWIQICFSSSVLVSAVALQSHGHWTFQRITSYILSYSYDSNILHNYAENGVSKRFQGPDSRFGTKVNWLTTPVTAKCFRMRDLTCVGDHCITKWEVLGCMKGLLPVITAQAKITYDINTEYNELTCQVSGQPYATIYWTLEDGTRIINNSYYQVIETQNLSDLSATYSVKLKILRAISSFIREDSNVKCNISSGLNVNCYMSYTCNAYYLQSEIGQKITAVTFTGIRANVGQPTVNLESVLATSARLSWFSPFGVFPVISYHISLTDQVDRQILEETISSTSRKYNNLKPYRNYTFKINAYNRFNINSNDIMTTFTTKQAEPSAITNFKAVAVSEYEIQLSWSPPNIHNGILSKYFIRHKLHNGSVNVNESSTRLLSFHLKHLQAYTTYQISIIATTRNNVLFGPPESKSIRTKQGKPSQPQNIRIEERKEWSGFSWQAPQKLIGVLQKYKVIIRGTKTYFPLFNYERHFETKTGRIEHNIYPGTNYTIHVRAVTGGGEGEVATSDFETAYANPQKPNITRKETLYDYQVVLFNVQPYTGPISSYEFGITNATDCFQNKVVLKHFHDGTMISMKKGVKELQVERRSYNLDLVETYRFCLRAIVNTSTIPLFGEEGEVSIDRKDLSLAAISNVKVSEVEINIPKGPPSTKYYVIIVLKTHSIHDPQELSVVRGFNESDPFKPYITGVFRDNRENFTVGDGEIYNYIPRKRRSVRSINRYQNIVNVQLQPNEQYDILIRAHEDEENFYSSLVSVKTKNNDYGYDGGNGGNSNDVITISVCVIVVVLLVFIFVFIVYRKIRQSIKRTEEKNKGLLPIGIENRNININLSAEEDNYELVDFEVKASLSKEPPAAVMLNTKHPPVKVNELLQHWKNLRKDSRHALSEEYKALDSGQLHEWTEASVSELKPKNRYGNMVPYNHSRVKLQGKTLNGFDYINASSIHGYNSEDMYIAAQGPNSDSLRDFWQMIWEQHVSVIVMLTTLIEKSKKKCEQYWPENGSQKHGKFQLNLTLLDQHGEFVVRTFSLTKVGSKDTRIIRQYHFLSWPERVVPEFPSEFLNFYYKVRKEHPVESMARPMLVHCSSGGGRTGTFICVDNMLKLARDRNMVDVFNYVNFMRSKRIHMVQNEDQYKFIYHCLYEAFTCGDTAIPVSSFKEEYQKLLSENPKNRNNTGCHNQYNILNDVTNQLTADQTTVAMKKLMQINIEEIFFQKTVHVFC